MKKALSLLLMLVFVVGCSSNAPEKIEFSTVIEENRNEKLVELFGKNDMDVSNNVHFFNGMKMNYRIVYDHYYQGKKLNDSETVYESESANVNGGEFGPVTMVSLISLDSTNGCEYGYLIALDEEPTYTREVSNCTIKKVNAFSTPGFGFPEHDAKELKIGDSSILNVMALNNIPAEKQNPLGVDATELDKIVNAYTEVFVLSIERY